MAQTLCVLAEADRHRKQAVHTAVELSACACFAHEQSLAKMDIRAECKTIL